MQSSLTVVSPARNLSFLTTYEARIGLGLTTSTSPTLEDMLEQMIEWSSAEIAVICNRVFAKETVTETFYPPFVNSKRIYLTRYPVSNIDSVTNDDVVVAAADYNLDDGSGTLLRLGSFETWGTVKVTYTGGYDLPREAPKPLRQAALLMTREAYYAAIRGDATVRSVSHKDSRVMYFDPNSALKALAGSGGSGGGSPARRAIGDLLTAYMSFWV